MDHDVLTVETLVFLLEYFFKCCFDFQLDLSSWRCQPLCNASFLEMMADYGSARVLSFLCFLELSEDVQGSEAATVPAWGLDMTQGAFISTFFFLFFFWMLICPM